LYLNGDKFSQTSDTSAVFAPAAVEDTVDTAFSFEDGVLHWRSPSFVTGQALFCDKNGVVIVVFNGLYPTNCTPIRLEKVAVDGEFHS
jgi:hypothetical protein